MAKRTPDDTYREMREGYEAYSKSKTEKPAAESKKPTLLDLVNKEINARPAKRAKKVAENNAKYADHDPEAGWAQFHEDHKNGALNEDPHSPKRVHLLDERPDDEDLVTDEAILHNGEHYTSKQLRALAEQGKGFVRSKNKKRTMAVKWPVKKGGKQ